MADDAAGSAPFDFAKPPLLTGTLYAIGSNRTQTLFTFRRTATVSNSTVFVQREFVSTNGAIAAREDVTYDSGRLVSYQMREFQAGVSGAIAVSSDLKNPARQKLSIRYGPGATPPAKGTVDTLPPDTVIDDNLYPFLLQHWEELMQGHMVKFQFVSLEHEKTYGFRFVRTGESVQGGRTVEQIRMEPSGFLVRKIVAPLSFAIEKDGAHRILAYTGRTTPRIKEGNKWQYLDAETVIDW